MNKKYIWVILALLCFLTSCTSQNQKQNPKTDTTTFSTVKQATLTENFRFKIIDPQTELSVGDTITYTAKFENLTGNQYKLEHAMPLISMYIYPESEKPQDIVGASLLTTALSKNEIITKTYNARIQETGNYILRAFCSFSIDGEHYFYAEEIELTVTE